MSKSAKSALIVAACIPAAVVAAATAPIWCPPVILYISYRIVKDFILDD